MRGGRLSLADAPQWLVSAFVRSAVAVGATAERAEIQRTAHALVARWQEPERRFHNLRHLTDVLARVEELAEETHVPDVVRLAAWYHGAVFNASAAVAYARRGGEDEVASAALAREELTALGVPDTVAERVSELILNLARHDADEHDVDALALCDADLGTLAVEPQRYAAYRKAIRAEYAHIPELDYVASRVEILTRLLQRRRLFVSPFSLAWEEPARENLTAELSHLRAKLRELGGSETPQEPGARRAAAGSATSWPSRAAATSAGGPTSPPDAAPRAEESAPAPSAGVGPASARPADPGGAGSSDRAAPTRSGDDDVPPSRATPYSASDGGPRGGVTPLSGGTPDEPPEERSAGVAGSSAEPLSGIERGPDLELPRRARKRRRDRRAAQVDEELEQSPGSLFRPPPRLPRS